MIKNLEKAIDSANQIVLEAKSLGIDIGSQTDKLHKATESISDDLVTIAMLGGFSDGKTTIISALQSKLLDGMKISTDESSNEIISYETNFLDNNFRIVDTPGLFGYKKEGKLKLSEKTIQYISEADLVIYVTEACNPLPESHQKNLQEVMRKLGKLKDAIFVINKMDQTDCELDDEESYAEQVAIKTENLLQRLMRCLHLTDEEAATIKIVCIAANPNDKDLSFWFEKKKERYDRLSHIATLRDTILSAISSVDVVALKQETSLSITKDAILCTERIAQNIQDSGAKALRNARSAQSAMVDKLAELKESLAQDQKSLDRTLSELKIEIDQEISAATLETLNEVLHHLGTDTEGKVDFSNVIQRIDGELLSCGTSASATIARAVTNIEIDAIAQDKFLNDAAKQGIEWLGKQKISPEMVNKVRDMFFKNFKFKPWGKIKLAGNINKWLGRVAGVFAIGMEIWALIKERQAAKKLDESKTALNAANTEIFREVRELYGTPEAFYNNFCPGYINLQKEVENRGIQLEEIISRNTKLSSLCAKIDAWKDEYLYEDAEFEDIIE